MRWFTVLGMAMMLAACARPSSTMNAASEAAFYVFRMQPPAVVQLGPDGAVLREVPVGIPGGCSLDGLFPAPAGAILAIQFNCEFGQAVMMVDTGTGKAAQPVQDTDSHFMAWALDGRSAYLKVDTMNLARIVRVPLVGKQRQVPVTELTYDLSLKPNTTDDFLFSFSRGMGLGSEMWLARSGGKVVQHVMTDAHSYLSFGRWSPDARLIAFIKVPDSATPFTVGELWVMQADGSQARKLGDADAGHGYAEAWSPDGKQIAFVVRENPDVPEADKNADALRSYIAAVSLADGKVRRLTDFPAARVEAPVWSPDGSHLAFTALADDKMNVYVLDMSTGERRQVLDVAACCPAWIFK